MPATLSDPRHPHNSSSPPELAALVQSRVTELLSIVEQRLGLALPFPQISLDLRGANAGSAYPRHNRIRFNAVLLRENQADFLAHTVAHEVAHLVAYRLYGEQIRPHGVEWRNVMYKLFELPPRRTHDYDIRNTAREPYVYRCQCPDRQHLFSTRRHRNALRGRQYICCVCHSALQFAYRRDLASGKPLHHLAIAHLLLAVDTPDIDHESLVHRLPTLFRGEPVGQVSLVYRPGAAISKWLQRTHTPVAFDHRYNFDRDHQQVLDRISHAVVFTEPKSSRVHPLLQRLRERPVPLRVLNPRTR